MTVKMKEKLARAILGIIIFLPIAYIVYGGLKDKTWDQNIIGILCGIVAVCWIMIFAYVLGGASVIRFMRGMKK